MYHTGICDESLSTRTAIHALSELKHLIRENVRTVTGKRIIEDSFKEVVKQKGCIYLRGIEIRGISLSDIYREQQSNSFYSDVTKNILNIVVSIIDAAIILKEKTGRYPSLLLHGIFIDSTAKSVMFFPEKLSEFISKYRTDSEQQLLSFCMRKRGRSVPETEGHISIAFGRLVYLFFTKNRQLSEDHIYDIRSYVKDTPEDFANLIWHLLRGKSVHIHELRCAIVEKIDETSTDSKVSLPLFRRVSLLRFRYAFLRFLSTRKKLLIVFFLVAGIFTYLVTDLLKSVDTQDYTAGLDAKQVVELYFKAVDELDINVIDAVFARGAGKEVKNEISTLYVTTRMNQAFGPGNVNQGEEALEDRSAPSTDAQQTGTQIYGIRDLVIEKKETGESPVFVARYEKFLSNGNKDTVYSIQEMIYLKKIDDRWYIISTERTLLNDQHSFE